MNQPHEARVLLGRLGAFWYLIPVVIVIITGLATCTMIDVVDLDRFEVEQSVADRSGVRHAVSGTHYHADSGETVACVWLTVGPAPSAGRASRPGEGCVLVARKSQLLRVSWQASGKVKAVLAAGSEPLADKDCYFLLENEPRRVCYSSQRVDVEIAPK
jgi:hypothetical protein